MKTASRSCAKGSQSLVKGSTPFKISLATLLPQSTDGEIGENFWLTVYDMPCIYFQANISKDKVHNVGSAVVLCYLLIAHLC